MIRWLYGRPLETLLATWGISLVLIQARAHAVRRAERAGGQPELDVGRRARSLPNLVLPYSRIVIIGFRGGRGGRDLAAAGRAPASGCSCAA